MIKSPESRLLKLGFIGKPHGLRGLFFVGGRSEPLPEKIKKVYLGKLDEESLQEYEVAYVGLHQERPVMSLKAFRDRTVIESQKEMAIFIQRSEVEIDPRKEYLWSDLRGKKIIDSDGKIVGFIAEIYNAGSCDILSVLGDTYNYELPLIEAYFEMDFDASDTSCVLKIKCGRDEILDFGVEREQKI